MAYYIDRDALEVTLNHRLNFLMAENGEYDHYTSGFDEAVTRVEYFPDADVAPVRHGRWILVDTDSEQFFICSECENKEYWESDYCPNCGARMDGGDEDG